MQRLLGGLAADCDAPMPAQMQSYLQETWRVIAAKTGAEFNHDFWRNCQPRRATYPACRAVIAARKQGAEFDVLMTEKIQHGYYLHAKNPSDDDALIAFAEELNLQVTAFTDDLNSPATQMELADEIAAAGRLGVTGFPSLLLASGDENQTATPIKIDYADADEMLKRITETETKLIR